MLDMTFDTTDIEAALDALAEHVKTNVIRAGSQAMAQEFYAEAKLRAPVLDHGHVFHGTHQKYFFPAGTLRNAIYQVFSKDNSSDGMATYHVSWNHFKAPYGFMVEYGTSRAPAHSFLRPAYEAVKQQAIAAGLAKMSEAMKK